MEEKLSRNYSVNVEFNRSTGMPMLVTWSNERGEHDAPADFPSQLRFNEKGALLYAHWKRAGEFDQPGDLPTRIHYHDETGKPYRIWWEKKGVGHREGDRPAYIELDPNTGQATEIHFLKNGQPFRSGGRLAYVLFDEDGTTRNASEIPVPAEPFDKRWLPDRLFPRFF